jgi:hypothetical protein
MIFAMGPLVFTAGESEAGTAFFDLALVSLTLLK